MKIDSDMLYGPCPCGSGKKFKFCCWPKCRDKLDDGMTREEIVQTVRCEEVGNRDFYWAPEGVTAFKDENRPPILRPMPKWRMKYTVSEIGEIEDDVNAVIEKLLRPYMRRYCSIASHDEEDTLEIAVQRIRLRKGKLPADCPSITMGKYSELWDILRHGLEEYFECQEGKTLVCEVWYDQMFGGPMLSIENPKGDIEMVTVAIPDHFGKDD